MSEKKSFRNLILTAGGFIFPVLALTAWLAGQRRIASVAAITSSALIMAPTLWRNSSAFGPIFTRFHTPRREVWLTIDDGPYFPDAPNMLDVLAHFRAPATFFLVGKQVKQYPTFVSQILAAGHTLGNHTEHHPVSRFWALPPSVMEKEIRGCTECLLAAGAPYPQWFRSPVGLTNPFVHPILKKQRLQLVGWHAGGMDGFVSPQFYWNYRILPRLRSGAILLLHQTPKGQGAATLYFLLQQLDKLGYTCVLPNEASLI